jgi:hypothetical protein
MVAMLKQGNLAFEPEIHWARRHITLKIKHSEWLCISDATSLS